MNLARRRYGVVVCLILFSALYGVLMVALNAGNLKQLHALSPYHRYQADALLQGHLYLADSIQGMQPGLAWHDGKVQQVWGLGVSLWLLPFVACWRLFGGADFPDRIALGVAFALLAFYACRAGWEFIKSGKKILGLGLVWLIILWPPVWTLARTSDLIFEETVLYGVLVSLGILVSIIRVALFGSRWDYLLGCVLSSFATWVRPTIGIYGLCGLLIATVIASKRNRRRDITLGISLWICSLVLLAWSNAARFGSATEFGHRQTVSTGSMVYLTRFGNPFRDASPLGAAGELAGMLFLNSNVQDKGAFSEDAFPGQSTVPRWRRLSLTTFDLTYAGLLLLGTISAAVLLVKRQMSGGLRAIQSDECTLVLALIAWSGVSTAILACFYLYYPAIASRYLLDFAPAFAGFAILAWHRISTQVPKLSLVLLAGWLFFELGTAKVPQDRQQWEWSAPTISKQRETVHTHGGLYTVSQHPGGSGIAWNGQGWESRNGFAEPVVILVVESPEFIEIRVGARRMRNGRPSRSDTYQAQIDGLPLTIRGIHEKDDEIQVLFEIPEAVKQRQKSEVLFLCFVAGFFEDDRNSERILYSVRWKSAPDDQAIP